MDSQLRNICECVEGPQQTRQDPHVFAVAPRDVQIDPPWSRRVYESLDALHFDESAADGTAVESTATVRNHSDFGLPITMLSCAAQVFESRRANSNCAPPPDVPEADIRLGTPTMMPAGWAHESVATFLDR